MADRPRHPLVHTLHGQFTRATSAFYARHEAKATLVAISRAQRADRPQRLAHVPVIPNPIKLQEWPLRERKHDYVLWVGRMTAEKGPHRAIAAARAADVPLVLAGVIQPGQQAFFDREVAPHIDGERVRFLGEIGGSLKRSAVRRRPRAADADQLARAVRDGHGRGAGVRHARDRLPRGGSERAGGGRPDRLPRRG